MKLGVLSGSARRQRGEELLKEVRWRRWAHDPKAFITECVSIRVLDGSGVSGRKPFEMYEYQEEFLDLMLRERFCLTLKARQLGMTTLTSAYALWVLLFRPATVLMMSKSQDDASRNLSMLAEMYRGLPEWVRSRGPVLESDAKTEKSWRHRDGGLSRIKSLPPTLTAGAGESADLVILDEFALFTVSNTQVWATVEPTTLAAASNPLSRGAVCVVVSTARSPDDAFASFWKQGRLGGGPGEGRFATFFVPASSNRFLWTDGAFDRVKYDAIRAEKAASGQVHTMSREYPLSPDEAFERSGHLRFDLDVLPSPDECVPPLFVGDLFDGVDGPEFRDAPGGKLRVWEFPRDDAFYVLSVDPSHGVGIDSTVAQVLAFDEHGDPYVAASWWSNTTEQAAAALDVFRIGRWFHGWQSEALLVFDSAGGHSELLIHVVRSMGYGNLYSYVRKSARRGRAGPSYGLTTAGVGGTRTLMVDNLAEALPRLGNLYRGLRDELGTFVVYPDGRAAAERGSHDDHVMCLAMGLWVLRDRFRPAPVARVVEKAVASQGSLETYLAGQWKLAEERERSDRRRLDRLSRRRRRR